jgi:MSHA biogenesis protein MshO
MPESMELISLDPGLRQDDKSRKKLNYYRRAAGFTLIELIVVIVISGILATVVSQLIQRPVESYQAQSRRAELVDIADTALRRISRDLRDALPNSVRVGCGGQCLEYLRTVSGGRYRSRPENDPFSLSFDPSDADNSFEVLGFLNDSSAIVTGANADDCSKSLASCVVIYNTGGTYDAYSLDNAATVTVVNIGSRITLGFDNSNFSSGQPAFPATSPEQHFFIVDTPVTYLCDLTQGTLRIYQGYNIQSDQTAVDSHAELTGQGNPAEHSLLAKKITGCDFKYDPGDLTRNALVTMELTVAETGESVTLLQQAHVSNVP